MNYDDNWNAVAKIAGVKIAPERVHACLVLALLQGLRNDEARLDVIELQLRRTRELGALK